MKWFWHWQLPAIYELKVISILVVYNLLLSLAIFQLILVRAVKVKDLSIITRNNFSFLANEFGRHQDSVKYTLHSGRKKTKNLTSANSPKIEV